MRHTLMVLVTDGEESGLMGAVALVGDREVSERLRAYLNLEALGPSGLPVLFESSDGLLVDGWRRAAPWPRGTSYATEIYKRLPNDTDFTILNARGIRGLNFATIGSSAVYHTARDTPDRVPRRTLRRSIENAVAIVRELDRGNLETGASGDRVFFDVLNLVALAYSMSAARLVALAALLLALGAWIKLIVDARRRGLVARLAMTAAWSLVGGVLIVSLMLGLTSTLRVVSGTLHPWYAHPDRFLALLAFAVLGGVSLLLRAGSLLPRWLQGSADARIVWSIALPVWALLAAGLEVVAPAASYLWVIPLLAAGISLLLAPAGSPALLRVGSLVVLVVAGALWIRDVHVLHGFVVEQMARLPLVAPAFIYVVLPAAAAVMLVPPGLASFHSETTVVRAWMHRATLVAASLCAVATFIAPAYSFDRPLRRFVRYVHDEAAGGATWEVGSLESDLGLEATDMTPQGWEPVDALVCCEWRLARPANAIRVPRASRTDAVSWFHRRSSRRRRRDCRRSHFGAGAGGQQGHFLGALNRPAPPPDPRRAGRARELGRLLRGAAANGRHARLRRADRGSGSPRGRLGDHRRSVAGWTGLAGSSPVARGRARRVGGSGRSRPAGGWTHPKGRRRRGCAGSVAVTLEYVTVTLIDVVHG